MYKYVILHKNISVLKTNDVIKAYNFYMSRNCKVTKIVTKKDYIVTYFHNGYMELLKKDII